MKSQIASLALFILLCILHSQPIRADDVISKAELQSFPSINPIQNGRYVKDFGVDKTTSKNEMHEGLDIQGELNSPVVAAAPGLVKEVSGNAGTKRVLIQHGDHLQTIYSNLQSAGIKKGETVKRGETLGRLGSRPIYYQVLIDGIPVDPLQYILKK
jgi:murein DD-endopeptidase MepM/ murein hydrolase activator NlpD